MNHVIHWKSNALTCCAVGKFPPERCIHKDGKWDESVAKFCYTFCKELQVYPLWEVGGLHKISWAQ